MKKAIILEGYKKNESSVYSEFKNFPYWGFMHDGISNFSSELNGIYIRYLDAENNPCSFPYTLTKARGDLNAYGMASHIIGEIENSMEVKGSTFETVVSKVSKYVKGKISPIPPNYFKLRKLKKVDIEKNPYT